MGSIVRIESEVPFGRTLYARLYLREWSLDRLVRHDQIETHYLAWETVRKQTNPFFQIGTGFEGYLIGRCPEPGAALDAVLAINQHILDGIFRLHRLEFGLRSRLMKTLVRETCDLTAVHLWSVSLGAELGRLRAETLTNAQARAFRTRTYQLVKYLPPVTYHLQVGDVTQDYAVGSDDSPQPNRMLVTLGMLKPCQQDAWLVAENIGEFGHPLVRKLLDCA